MRCAIPVILVAVVLCAGCAMHPPAQPTALPRVGSSDYDVLWNATLNTVQKHFDLFVQRKDEGYIQSTYKRGDPLPGGALAVDAQTRYDKEEDLLQVTRRQLTARVQEQSPGLYVVYLEVIRERQGYSPPEPRLAPDADIYQDTRRSSREAADRAAKVTWFRLGRDGFLEQKLLERIAADVRARGVFVEPPPAPVEEAPQEESSPSPAPDAGGEWTPVK